MAAAEQIKLLIKSFTKGDDDQFYATAMQIAASEARKGHTALAEELKNLIKSAKGLKRQPGTIHRIPINEAQKELNDLLELDRPKTKLKDMVLSADVEISIKRILDEQKKLALLYEHNLQPRRKILLAGYPGCGKTMTANMIAGELGLPLFTVRLDGLISRYMGESISKLRLIFDSMSQFRAVYLFDEFDSIGTSRNLGGDVGEIKRVLNSFLVQIERDSSHSIIVAATNMYSSLDTALFRRFDDIIIYSLPTEKQILQFYKKELKNISEFNKIEIQKISKDSVGLSYADLRRVCEDYMKQILIYNNRENLLPQIIEFIRLRKKNI